MKNERTNKRSRSEGDSEVSTGKGTLYKSKDKRNTRGRRGNSSRSVDLRNSDSNSVSHSRAGIANDESWYTSSPEQVANVANVSFVAATGKPIIKPPVDLPAASDTAYNLVPSASGVLRVGYLPTFGNPQQPSDALNVGLQKTYAFTRSLNSGTRVYYYPDFGKYIMVMDSAYAFAGMLIRAVGYMNSFSSANKFLPQAIFKAMGFDYNDIATRQPEFRTIVNNYIAKINTMNVPNTLPVFKRHFWLGSNVYCDADNPWSQLYVHVPEAYAKYNYETANVDLIMLHNQFSTSYVDPKVDEDLLTVDKIKTICDDITSAILLSETFSVMSGDIFKAYGSNLFKIEGVSESFMLYPVYDAGVLNQIMNGRFCGGAAAVEGGNFKVAQQGDTIFSLIEDVDGGYLRLGYPDVIQRHTNKRPVFSYNAAHGTGTLVNKFIADGERLINITSLAPTPGMILESTRTSAVVVPDNIQDEGNWQWLEASGADVYTTMRIYYFETDIKTGVMSLLHTYDSVGYYSIARTVTTNIIEAIYNWMDFASRISHFDWHPPLITFAGDKSGAQGKARVLPPLIDTYNTALVSKDVLINMHEVANMSLFDITMRNTIKR